MFKDSEEPKILEEDTKNAHAGLKMPEFLPFSLVSPKSFRSESPENQDNDNFRLFDFDLCSAENSIEKKTAVQVSAADRLTIEEFFEKLNKFNMTYGQRFCYKGSQNFIINAECFAELLKIINSVDDKILRLIQENNDLKVCFQVSLQGLLKKIDLLEAENLKLNNKDKDLSLEYTQQTCLGRHYDNLTEFKTYVKSGHYLVKFRYLLPISDWDPRIFPGGVVPEILSVSQVNAFIARVKTLYGVAFKEKIVFTDRLSSPLADDQDDICNTQQQMPLMLSSCYVAENLRYPLISNDAENALNLPAQCEIQNNPRQSSIFLALTEVSQSLIQIVEDGQKKSESTGNKEISGDRNLKKRKGF